VHRLVRIAFGVLKHQKPYDPLWSSRTPQERECLVPALATKRLRRKNARRLARMPSEEGAAGSSGDAAEAARQRRAEIFPRRRWSAADVELLHAEAGRTPVQQLAARLGRTHDAVQLKINAEGLSALPRSG
jgi:hypothetical protein